jgi:mycoredoxin
MSRTSGEATADLVVYGKPDCVDALRSRRLLGRNGVPYEFRDILNDADLAAEARRISGGARTPVLVFADGSFVVEPSDAELADLLGLPLNAVVAEGAETCEV